MDSLLEKRQNFMKKALVDMENSADELLELLDRLSTKVENLYKK